MLSSSRADPRQLGRYSPPVLHRLHISAIADEPLTEVRYLDAAHSSGQILNVDTRAVVLIGAGHAGSS